MKSSDISIISPEEYQSMPWRNGLGTTIELLKKDLPGDEGFAWRLSMAEVTSDGEFSNFGGYDRCLLLLEGGGITLDCNGQQHRLEQPLQAARFRGEDQTCASLHSGPIKDFNIMTHRQHCSARVSCGERSESTEFRINATILLIYAVDGDLQVDSQCQPLSVPARHLLVIEKPDVETINCSAANSIVIQISDIHDA
jgi:environmental stress-induced protein Ves